MVFGNSSHAKRCAKFRFFNKVQILACLLFISFLDLRKILRQMVYSFMVFEARFSPKEPLKVSAANLLRSTFEILSISNSTNTCTLLAWKKNFEEVSLKMKKGER